MKKIVDIFNSNYRKGDAVPRMKAISLIVLYLLLFVWSSFSVVVNLLTGTIRDDIGTLTTMIVSPVFIFLLLSGKLKFVSYFANLFFAFFLTFRFALGEFKEYYVVFYFLLILFSLVLLSRDATNFIIVYSLISHASIYYLKHDIQDFSPGYLPISLLSILIVSLVSILNREILSYYIKKITKRKERLEIMVRKRTEDLRSEKVYSEQLVHQSPCAIFTTDNEGKVVDFNKKAEDITGYSRDEVIGRTFAHFIADGSSSGRKGDIPSMADNECLILTKEGSHKIIERHTSQLHNEQGEVIGDIESFIDLTEWKEMEDYKKDIERIIRHDLKTPLNTIIGFPRMMMDEGSLSEEQISFLQHIHDAGKNMLDIIHSSQSLYKLEQGAYEIHPEDTDLISIIRQIDLDLTEVKKKKRCPIVCMMNDDFIEYAQTYVIRTESILIYMILSNLVKNALEASPVEKPVLIRIDDRGPLVIRIMNSGVIPDDIRNSFFDKYVTAFKKGGTGLGTYSAKLAAKAIGADLTFRIENESETVLTLTFSR